MVYSLTLITCLLSKTYNLPLICIYITQTYILKSMQQSSIIWYLAIFTGYFYTVINNYINYLFE
jgi:hypothetical protein